MWERFKYFKWNIEIMCYSTVSCIWDYFSQKIIRDQGMLSKQVFLFLKYLQWTCCINLTRTWKSSRVSLLDSEIELWIILSWGSRLQFLSPPQKKAKTKKERPCVRLDIVQSRSLRSQNFKHWTWYMYQVLLLFNDNCDILLERRW